MNNAHGLIYKLVAHPESGVPIDVMAAACYELSKQLGIPVEFVHNDRTYTVRLMWTEKEKPA